VNSGKADHAISARVPFYDTGLTISSRLDAGEDLTIIDLRTPLEVTATPYAIPGSCWLAADAIHEHEAEFLRSRDVVLYCASAYDATSASGGAPAETRGDHPGPSAGGPDSPRGWL
jgi:hypothetical protein